MKTNHIKLKKYNDIPDKELVNYAINFWNKYSDREFTKTLYKKIGIYLNSFNNPMLLDIGVEKYNIINKKLLNNNKITYIQMEPSFRGKMINDGLMECIIQNSFVKYPQLKESFNIILSFGVLGWESIKLNQDEIVKYINNVLFLLKNNGIFIIKFDSGYEELEDKYKIKFNKHIYPYFNPIPFIDYNCIEECGGPRPNGWRPHFSKRDSYKFYFLQKKRENKKIFSQASSNESIVWRQNIINSFFNNHKKKLVIVAHPDDESIWAADILDENTHVIIITDGNKAGTRNIREKELESAMNITKSSWEFLNYPEKRKWTEQKRNNVISNIEEKFNIFKNLEEIYTHNNYGEYGHYDHIETHKCVTKAYINFYPLGLLSGSPDKNIEKPKLFIFWPKLNYDSPILDNRLKNIPTQKEDEKHKILLDQYKTQTVNIFRNICYDYKEFLI